MNVGHVVLAHPTPTTEEFFQLIGRAGRRKVHGLRSVITVILRKKDANEYSAKLRKQPHANASSSKNASMNAMEQAVKGQSCFEQALHSCETDDSIVSCSCCVFCKITTSTLAPQQQMTLPYERIIRSVEELQIFKAARLCTTPRILCMLDARWRHRSNEATHGGDREKERNNVRKRKREIR